MGRIMVDTMTHPRDIDDDSSTCHRAAGRIMVDMQLLFVQAPSFGCTVGISMLSVCECLKGTLERRIVLRGRPETILYTTCQARG